MPKLRWEWFLLAAWSLHAPAQTAPVPTITLEEALERARANSVPFQAALTESKVAHEDRVQARAALLPSLSYTNQYLYTEGNGTPAGRFIASNGVHEYLSQGNAHQALNLGLGQIAEFRRTGAAAALARAKAEIAARGLVATVVLKMLAHSTRPAALTAILGLAVICGCSKEAAEKEPVVTVQTAPVRQTSIQNVVTAEAILFPLHQAAITPKVNAPVRQFYVNRGSRVHRGELLAVMENRDLAAAEMENKGTYEQAEAAYQTTTAASLPEEMQKAELDVQATKQALDATQKLYHSRQSLFQQGALPRKSLDEASVALVQARNQYEVAQKHFSALQSVGHKEQLKAASGQLTSAKGKYLGSAAQVGYTEIRSPIDGVVTDRPLYPGEMSPAGTPLLTVMDTSEVIARAHPARGRGGTQAR